MGTVGTIVMWTFVVIILIWVLTKYQAFDEIVKTFSKAYTDSIKALLPQQAG
jgi:hypothetical protein